MPEEKRHVKVKNSTLSNKQLNDEIDRLVAEYGRTGDQVVADEASRLAQVLLRRTPHERGLPTR